MNLIKKAVKDIIGQMGYQIVRKEGYNSGPLTKLTDELEYFETQTGKYYLPKYADGDGIAYAIKNNSIFDENIYNIGKKYIESSSIVLDVGSNFGQMAVMFSRCCSNGLVYAFEASPVVYPILAKNCALNATATTQVKPFHCAVHCKSGDTLYFEDYDFSKYGTYGSFGIDYINGKGTPVKTIALDDLEYPLPVSFMKIDVEGGDLLVLKGARKTIEKFKMPIIFEYSYQREDIPGSDTCFQDYVDFVEDIGYRFERCIDAINYLIVPK